MIDINPSQTGDKPLNLSDFAQHNQITEDRVWELIEEGELAARFVNDEILILREHEMPAEPTVDLQPVMAEVPVATAPEPEPQTVVAKPATAMSIEPEKKAPPKPAFEEPMEEDINPLLTDDHHDLLMFAQDAMNRTMDLSRQLLATKDELIRMKDERIQYLQADLQKKDQEIRLLKGKVEDLETLCRLNPL